MCRIRLEECVAAVRELLNFVRQRTIRAPEPRTGKVLHSSVVRLARCSLSACRASASRRPASTSSASCRSHTAASYSANHLRKRARSFLGSRFTAPLICSTVVIWKQYPRRDVGIVPQLSIRASVAAFGRGLRRGWALLPRASKTARSGERARTPTKSPTWLGETGTIAIPTNDLDSASSRELRRQLRIPD